LPQGKIAWGIAMHECNNGRLEGGGGEGPTGEWMITKELITLIYKKRRAMNSKKIFF